MTPATRPPAIPADEPENILSRLSRICVRSREPDAYNAYGDIAILIRRQAAQIAETQKDKDRLDYLLNLWATSPILLAFGKINRAEIDAAIARHARDTGGKK